MKKRLFVLLLVLVQVFGCIGSVCAEDEALPITVIPDGTISTYALNNTDRGTNTQAYMFPTYADTTFREKYLDSEDYAFVTQVRMTLDNSDTLNTDAGAFGEIAYGSKSNGKRRDYPLVRCVAIGEDKFNVLINKNFNITTGGIASPSTQAFETVLENLGENTYVNVKIISVRNTIHYYLSTAWNGYDNTNYKYYGSTTGYWATYTDDSDCVVNAINLSAVNVTGTTIAAARFKSLKSELQPVSVIGNGVRHYVINPDDFSKELNAVNGLTGRGVIADNKYRFELAEGDSAKALTAPDMTNAIKGTTTDILSGKSITLNTKATLNSGSGNMDIYLVDGDPIENLVRLSSNDDGSTYNILANATSALAEPNTIIASGIPYGEYADITIAFCGTDGSNVKYYVNGEQACFDVTDEDGAATKDDSVTLSPICLGWKFKYKAAANSGSAFASSIDYVDSYVSDNENPVRLTLDSATDSIAADGDIVLTFSNQVGSNARGNVYINDLPVEDGRIKVSGDMKTVRIAAPANGYDSGVTFNVKFANGDNSKVLCDVNGNILAKKGTTAEFSVTGDKRDYMAYLVGISGIDDSNVTSVSPTIAVRNMTDTPKKYIFIAATYDSNKSLIGVEKFQAYDISAGTEDIPIESFSVTPTDGVALMRFYVWDNDSCKPIMRNTIDISVN